MRLSALKKRILVATRLDVYLQVPGILRKVGSSYPSVHRSLCRLEKDGLMERREHNNEVWWHPTYEGERIGLTLRKEWASEQSRRTASLPLEGIKEVLQPWLMQSSMKELKEFVLWVMSGKRLHGSRDSAFWGSVSSVRDPALQNMYSEECEFMEKYAEIWDSKTTSERRSLLKRLDYIDSVIEEWVDIPFDDIRRSGRLKIARLLSDPGSRSHDSQEETDSEDDSSTLGDLFSPSKE